MRIGDYSVDSLNAGDLRLDGGAMFGVVPRTLWEREMPPDDRNRIAMTMNVLLVRGPGITLLVDTGAGSKEDERFRDLYAMGPALLNSALASRGVEPGDVDVVFNTHLHFDHAGGNTRRDASGKVVASFPKARYIVQADELAEAEAAHERNRASYLPDNWRPLAAEGRLETLHGEAEIAPGLHALPLPGHTRGLQGLLIESGNDRGLFLADCVPTSHHVPLPWIMAYDLYPLETLETKRRILPRAAREGWVVFFEHDPAVRAARLSEDKPLRFSVHPVEA